MFIKSTFLILLSLVVSSLSFGEVIKVQYNTVTGKGNTYNAHIRLISDKELPYYSKLDDKQELTIRFKCMDHPIMPNAFAAEENKKEMLALKMTLSKIFSLPSYQLEMDDKKYIHPITFRIHLEDLFIRNGYQLTYRELIDEDDTNEYLSQWFFYKPD